MGSGSDLDLRFMYFGLKFDMSKLFEHVTLNGSDFPNDVMNVSILNLFDGSIDFVLFNMLYIVQWTSCVLWAAMYHVSITYDNSI